MHTSKLTLVPQLTYYD